MTDEIKEKTPEQIPGTPFPTEVTLKELEDLHGIGETNDVLAFVCSLGVAAKEVYADKKISASDLFHLIPPAKKILPAINGLDKIDDELTDKITDEELGVLKNTIIESGVLEGDAEAAAVDGLELGRNIKAYIFKYYVKK